MISLIIPPKDQIARISKMLADEFGTASNIKSRVNRLSVLGAITSVQHRLKLYAKGIGSLSGQYIFSIMKRLTTILLLQFLLMVWSFTVEQ
jgi:peptide subunit release factor 1 (eRF1)